MNYNFLKEILYYPQLSLPVLLPVLAVAFILGAIHALGPGHGKSLMAAYLVGSSGRIRDAIVLSLAITLSHVFSVIVLGLIALWLTDFFLPEKISRWPELVSGVAIFAIGLWLLRKRFRLMTIKNGPGPLKFETENINASLLNRQENNTTQTGTSRALSSFHHHDHGHDHSHFNPGISIWSNIALGFSGGIVPCPKAIVILLLAISLQKIALGITIIVVFSLGLASVLLVLGIIMVKASWLLAGRFEGRWQKLLPVLGAIVIMCLGIFLTINTLVLS